MRFQMPHFPTEFEIPDEWLDEAGFQGFSPASRFFRSSPEAILVPLTAIEPVARFVAHPKDWRGFDRKRLVSVLKGILRFSWHVSRCHFQTSGPTSELGPLILQQRTRVECISLSVSCQGTKSLRSSPLRG